MDENKEKKFISERILGREVTPGRAVRWVLLSLACGIVFGLAVFGVNWLAKSAAEKAEQKQEKKAAEVSSEVSESVPQTEGDRSQRSETEPETKESEAKKEPETKKESETEETPEEGGESGTDPETEEGDTEEKKAGETEPGGMPADPELVHEALLAEREAYPFGTEELNTILSTQADVCENISGYIVTVCNTISEMTWFESTVETQRKYSGVIVAADESEILVLTVYNAVKDDGVLSVTFHDGTRNEAVLRKASDRDGLAVVAVPVDGLGTDFAEGLEGAEISDADSVRAGSPVITAGSPMGIAGSFGFGNVNFVAEPESVEDGSLLSCYSEAPSVPEAGTFLMTVDGKLLGLAAAKKENAEVNGNRFIIAASCQNLIESLKKGNAMAWLGITGADISFDMKNKNIPEGMYVTAVNESGPAFAAGLKRGDIIVMIGARDIRGTSDYQSFMRNLRPGETVTMTIRREAVRSEYKEMELEMTAGTR